MSISCGGVAVIALAGGDGQGRHYGSAALLVVGAALCAAIMGMLQKPLLREYGAPAITGCLMASGALLLTPFLPGALRVAMQPAARASLLATIFLGIGPAALGYLAWSVALRRFTLSQTASMLYVVPLVALAISSLWLHEVPSPVSLIGGLMAVAGVIVLNRFGGPSAAAPPRAAPAEAMTHAGAGAERSTQ
jgi:drug/metabolite transporter (DMT)-like permease